MGPVSPRPWPMLQVSSVLLPLEIINCTGLPAGPVTVILPPLPHLGPGQAKNGCSLKSETQRLLTRTSICLLSLRTLLTYSVPLGK